MGPKKKHDLNAPVPERPESAARQFTDREGFLSAFETALAEQAPDRHKVLVFYGVGGIGKSRLIRRLRNETPDENERRVLPTGVPHAKVDFQDPQNRLPGKALERARAQLHRHGVRFPTFDIAFAVWWKLANPALPLSKSELRFFDESEVAGELIGLMEDAPVLGLVAKLPRFVDRASQAVRDWYTKRGQAALAHIAGLDDKNKVEEWLPAFFGADLRVWLAEEAGRRAVLFFDTHEALWEERGSGESGTPPDEWVRDWAAHLGGTLVVIAGRNKLRWDEEDEAWEVAVEQHIVGDLSPEDAEWFLVRAGVREPEVRAALVERSEGVPQYLNLAVDTYERIREGEGRPPRPDEFDANLGRLLDQFLHYVQDQRRQALFVLSVPETFDYARFRDLMREFGGGVMATREGMRSVTQFSFVDEPEESRYALHALVREALAAKDNPEDRAEVHRHLFKRAQEVLKDVDLRSVTDEQRRALREGVEHGQAVLDPEVFLRWYWAAEEPFPDTSEWRTLLPLVQQIVDFAEDKLGRGHPDTLDAINNLGLLLKLWGDLDGAETLYRRALEGYDWRSNDSRLKALGIVGNIGSLLCARGDFRNAETYLRQALDGYKNMNVSGSMNELNVMINLGLLLRDRGDLDGAEPLLRKALDGCKDIFGQDDPNTLRAANSLGVVLRARGDLDTAEKLYRYALEGRERVLGPDHPDTLRSANNLALIYQLRKKYTKAELLCRRALEGRERILRPEHPDVFTSSNNLGVILKVRGDLDGAEKLHRRALEGRERILGADHPHTLMSASNLGGLLEARGDSVAAEELYRWAVEGAERRLGLEHPDTKRYRNQLSTLLATK